MLDKSVGYPQSVPELTPEQIKLLLIWMIGRGHEVAQIFADEPKRFVSARGTAKQTAELRDKIHKEDVNWGNIQYVKVSSHEEGALIAGYSENMSCGCHPEYEERSTPIPHAWLFMSDEELRAEREKQLMTYVDQIKKDAEDKHAESMRRQREAEEKAKAKSEAEKALDAEFGPKR